jgi:hypothetical protein
MDLTEMTQQNGENIMKSFVACTALNIIRLGHKRTAGLRNTNIIFFQKYEGKVNLEVLALDGTIILTCFFKITSITVALEKFCSFGK